MILSIASEDGLKIKVQTQIRNIAAAKSAAPLKAITTRCRSTMMKSEPMTLILTGSARASGERRRHLAAMER